MPFVVREPMDYFCYISRAKVDQLLENIESTRADVWKESASRARKSGAKLEGGFGVHAILNLFKGEVSYGREGTVQIEREVKRHYLEKLRLIIESLVANEEVSELLTDLEKDLKFEYLYYHYSGQFYSRDFDQKKTESQTLVTISSEIGGSLNLLLDCSLRYFSESNSPDGRFQIHSANERFFKGEIPLTLETVFLYLHHDETKIYGSPLFLKLYMNAGNRPTRI